MGKIFFILVYRNFFNGTCDEYFFMPGADMSLITSKIESTKKSNCTTICTGDVKTICAESVNKVAKDEELLDFENSCQLDNYNCMHRTARTRLEHYSADTPF